MTKIIVTGRPIFACGLLEIHLLILGREAMTKILTHPQKYQNGFHFNKKVIIIKVMTKNE